MLFLLRFYVIACFWVDTIIFCYFERTRTHKIHSLYAISRKKNISKSNIEELKGEQKVPPLLSEVKLSKNPYRTSESIQR